MELLNTTPFPIGFLPGRMNFPRHSMTITCKATFRLEPEGTATLMDEDEQESPSGNQPFDPADEEGVGSLRYESDDAPYKPRADLLLVGNCHTPGGKPLASCRVRFKVGRVERALQVLGDREWRGVPLLRRPSSPRAFTTMPLCWENAYGGRRDKRNPTGKGRGKLRTAAGAIRALPNLEDPSRPVRSTLRRYAPACFAPARREWKPRRKLLGRYRKKWLKTRWPWFPEDFDFGFFNCARRDMQVPGYLQGDEELRFENLHPSIPDYRSRLPGLRVRCFTLGDPLDEARADSFQEVTMNLDTLWVDMDRELVVLIWRGWTPVRSGQEDGIGHVYVVSEPLDQGVDLAEHERRLRAHLADEPDAEPEAEPVEELAPLSDEEREMEEGLAALKAHVAEQGIDLDNPPPRSEEEIEAERRLLEELGFTELDPEPDIDRAWVEAQVAAGESLAGRDLTGLDLSGLKLVGVDLSEALLEDAILEECDLTGANLTAANLARARMTGTNLSGAQLAGADLHEAVLTGADLSRATLDGTTLDQAQLQRANLTGVSGADLSAVGANLDGAVATAAVLPEADFTSASMKGLDLSDAKLPQAVLEGAQAAGLIAVRADLTELRAAEGCDLTSADLTEVRADDSIWEGAQFRGAVLRYGHFAGADFTGADLRDADLSCVDAREARFTGACLERARLIRTNLFQASFEAAQLEQADFTGSNCYGAEFLDVRVANLHGRNMNLKMTKRAKQKVR